MSISVYGAGTLGSRVLARITGTRWAITRTPRRHTALRSLGVHPTLDWEEPEADSAVVLAIPGSASQAEAIARLRHRRPPRAVLVSTTGLYAPYAGRIAANSPAGASDRAQQAAATEAAFRDWMGDDGVIVRLGGLYTRDRGPAAHYARENRIRLAPPDAPLPLIHYDDAAQLVVRALRAPAPPVVLGVVQVVERETFYRTVAAHLGRPTPAFGPRCGVQVDFDLSTREQLLPAPAHPDFRTCLPVG